MPPLTNLRAVRESKALTQGELAQRAGTTQHTISRIEQGTLQQPRLTTVRRLAAALDVAPAELMAPSLGAGIYALRDSDSSAVYVGASSDISARFAAHRVLLRTRRQRSTVLQGAWDNGTLVFEVLERTATTPGALQTAERRWIDQLRNEGHQLVNSLSYRPPTPPKAPKARSFKFSISLPTELLARVDKLLARPGEGRNALFARVLGEAVRAAEDAEIDAEYERAYAEHPIAQEERRVLDAFTKASVRSLYPEPGPRG